MSTASRFRPNNQLLAALPNYEYERFSAHLHYMRLPKNRVLYHAGDAVRYVYFPTSGMCSLLATTEKGALLEVGVVGNDGLVGLPTVLRISAMPYQVIVQLETNAFRLRADILRAAFDRGGRLQDLLLKYAHSVLMQVSQAAVCNRFHTIEARLSRWLLISQDRVQGDIIHLTQEFLSYMLGVPRTGVTLSAGNLQKKHLINYARGKITILDRTRLERAACECYRILRAESARVLAA